MDITLKELIEFAEKHSGEESVCVLVIVNNDVTTFKVWLPDFDISSSETICEPELSKEEVYELLFRLLDDIKPLKPH